MPHTWHSCVWLILSCNSVDFLHTGHRPEATWVGDQDNILLPCGINGLQKGRIQVRATFISSYT